MTRHTHDQTTHETISTTAPGARLPVADRVQAALDELDRAFVALAPAPTTATDWSARSAAYAAISARRAGWWRVLLVDNRHTRALHPLHARAVLIAHRRAQDDARFWRELAQDWTARAEQRPTSDAAGGLSNWAELGVTG